MRYIWWLGTASANLPVRQGEAALIHSDRYWRRVGPASGARTERIVQREGSKGAPLLRLAAARPQIVPDRMAASDIASL
jgi:hypothetical protein